MARFARICLTLEPLNELTIPCDQFEVDEEGNVAVYLNGELWGFFTSPEYVHILDSDYEANDEDDEDESADSQELDDSDAVSVVIPDDLSDLPEVSVSDEERDSR